MAMLAILVSAAHDLGWTAVAAVVPFGVSQLGNAGPHGFSEMLYLFTSRPATTAPPSVVSPPIRCSTI